MAQEQLRKEAKDQEGLESTGMDHPLAPELTFRGHGTWTSSTNGQVVLLGLGFEIA